LFSTDLSPNRKAKTALENKIIVPRDGHELLGALSHQHAYTVNAEHTDDEEIAELIRSVLQAIEFRDSVRVIGNNAVHPAQIDTNDAELTNKLFPLVNLIVEYVSIPGRVSEQFAAGAKNAVEKRDTKK
jgi:hypothetical protein